MNVVVKIKKNGEYDPTEPNTETEMLLIIAVIYGQVPTCDFLIKNGTDVNTKDKDGDTLLHYAAEHGRLKVCELLVENGATVNAINKDGKTPLHHAVYIGYSEVCEFFISKCRSNVNIKDKNGETPLHLAAKNNCLKTCEIILGEKVEIDAKDNKGNTALHLAAQKGHLRVCELLIVNKINLNIQDNGGNTALHVAANNGWFEICKLLIKAGIEINLKNGSGMSAVFYVDFLWERGKMIYELMIKNGAEFLGRGSMNEKKWRQEYLMKQAIKTFFKFRIRQDKTTTNGHGYTFPDIYFFGDNIVAACFPDLSRKNLFEVEQMLLKHLGIDDLVVAPEDRILPFYSQS